MQTSPSWTLSYCRKGTPPPPLKVYETPEIYTSLYLYVYLCVSGIFDHFWCRQRSNATANICIILLCVHLSVCRFGNVCGVRDGTLSFSNCKPMHWRYLESQSLSPSLALFHHLFFCLSFTDSDKELSYSNLFWIKKAKKKTNKKKTPNIQCRSVSAAVLLSVSQSAFNKLNSTLSIEHMV